MKHFPLICTCLLGGIFLTAGATRATADEWDKKTYITTSQSIEVPGAVLPPGKYVFKLLNSQSDRHIVQIFNADENHLYATNLAIPRQRMEPADKTIITFYEMPGGGPEPIKAWFYPGDTVGQEFRYSSKRASEIARATSQPVPALSASASATEVNPAPAPAVSTAPANETPPVAPPAESTPEVSGPPPSAEPEASAEEPPPPPAPPVEQTPPPAPTSEPAPAMPQTASDLPLFGLVGMGCLGLAALLRSLSRRPTSD